MGFTRLSQKSVSFVGFWCGPRSRSSNKTLARINKIRSRLVSKSRGLLDSDKTNIHDSLVCISLIHRSNKFLGSRGGAVVRALDSHRCDLGSTPGPGVTCGLSLLCGSRPCSEGFSPSVFFPVQI